MQLFFYTFPALNWKKKNLQLTDDRHLSHQVIWELLVGSSACARLWSLLLKTLCTKNAFCYSAQRFLQPFLFSIKHVTNCERINSFHWTPSTKCFEMKCQRQLLVAQTWVIKLGRYIETFFQTFWAFHCPTCIICNLQYLLKRLFELP